MLSKRVKIALVTAVIVVGVLACGLLGVFLGYNYVMSQTERYQALEKALENKELVITEETPGAVMVIINSGDSTSNIAKSLKELKLIDNELFFTVMSKFNGFDGGYLAGTHFLTPDLTYDEIMYLLCQDPKVTRITFPEGVTYIQLKQLLKQAGLSFYETELDDCMNSANQFVDYSFVSQIKADDDRDFILNGYLFPDTYDFDMNASAEDIVRTFLRNTENYLIPDYYFRAEKLGMSMDEVLVLASIIQNEANVKKEYITDMFLISAVFHNRLNSDDPGMRKLQSCASINFLREKDGLPKVWAASTADQMRESPYNTYMYEGLPPGPICMPGKLAIQAALYPEPNVNYYYFCATGDGGTAFAVTLEEHEANVAAYEQYWNDQNAQEATETTESDND
ncbi:MAG: endolytic transglycosylase MltG [Clostridiales bacterium]|nr:endolytic transglycosylase MltG [Clostridiales bacterium]